MSKIIISQLIDDKKAKHLKKVISEMSPDGFYEYGDPDFEYLKRTQNKNLPSEINDEIARFCSTSFISEIEKQIGISGLKPDPLLWGGGIHITEPGGYLAMHEDFNVLPTSYRSPVQMLRAVNLILFLSDGAALQADNVSIQPKPGRAVLFTTNGCVHGHPEITHTTRTSLAIYYYVEDVVRRNQWHSTKYYPLSSNEPSIEMMAKIAERADSEERYAKWMPENNQDIM